MFVRIFHSVWKIRNVNIKVQQSWPKCILCICLFILFVLICVPFVFLVMSGLAAACNCGTPWTYLWSFLKKYTDVKKKRFTKKIVYLATCTACKCESVVYLDFWLCFTQWHIENLVQSFFFFFFLKTWVGPTFIRMHRARVAQAYMWYLPISEGAPYILPIFWENLPSKIWEFTSLFNHSPYLKKKISLFVISNVSHVWAQAFFFLVVFFNRIS